MRLKWVFSKRPRSVTDFDLWFIPLLWYIWPNGFPFLSLFFPRLLRPCWMTPWLLVFQQCYLIYATIFTIIMTPFFKANKLGINMEQALNVPSCCQKLLISPLWVWFLKYLTVGPRQGFHFYRLVLLDFLNLVAIRWNPDWACPAHT